MKKSFYFVEDRSLEVYPVGSHQLNAHSLLYVFVCLFVIVWVNILLLHEVHEISLLLRFHTRCFQSIFINWERR